MSGKRGGGNANSSSNAAGSGSSSGNNAGAGGSGSGSGSSQDHTSIVLEYLIKRGYSKAASALKDEIDPSSSSATTASPSKNAATTVSQEAFERRNLGSAASAFPAKKREDPMPWRDGLLGLREFVYGSLDIHRPELLPILLPVFVHSYLDLVLLGYKDQAELIFQHFTTDYSTTNPSMVQLLGMLKTPQAVLENEQAARWRKERYIVRMTRRGWSLLLGWLQGGISGQSGAGTLSGAIGQGAVASTNNEITERGREKMLGIINERVRVDVIDAKQQHLLQSSSGQWTQGGLESELSVDVIPLPGSLPDLAPGTPAPPQQSSSSSVPQIPLKLGPMPADPKLEKEVQRALQGSSSNDATSTSIQQPSTLPPLQTTDLPPYPPSFRTVDVRREVEKVREARKRIRLGPVEKPDTTLTTSMRGVTDSQARWNLPSVCMFTIHDSGDTLISTNFSEDSSLLAAGFSESYIRLWNLKGEPLNGTRSNFEPYTIQSSSDLSSLTELDGPSSRKLIAHSGPVYSTSFDPTPGPSGPPRYLLSASQDASVRLWNLQTYSNIVSYRGHRDAVWDVEWGPRGMYFATASRDRTARLWTTERVAAVRVFAGHLSDVDCVKFHPNSLYLATGSSDRTCRLWDVQKGMCLRVFVGHSGPVTSIAMSPDGRYLASAGDDCSVNLWDLSSSRLVKSMTGHTGRVHSLSFSAESSILVSGSADCTVKVWDVLSSRVYALATKENGAVGSAGDSTRSGKEGQDKQDDMLVSLPTKRTPIFSTKFTPRNLCLAAGPIF